MTMFRRLLRFRPSLPQARRILVGIGVLCGAGLLLGTLVLLERDRQHALQVENERGMLLATMLESHVSRTLNSVDNTLNAIGRMLAPSASHPGSGANRAEVRAQLETVAFSSTYLRSLSILDSAGRVVFSSNAKNIGRQFSHAQLGFSREINGTLEAGYPLFIRDLHELDDNADTDSLRNRGIYALPFAKLVPGSAGQLMFVALMHPAYLFPGSQSAADDGDSSYAALFDYQGTVLAATPDSPYLVGKRYSQSPLVRQLNNDQEFGAFRSSPGTDGGEHLANFRASLKFPLAAMVGTPEWKVLAAAEAASRNLRLIGLIAASFGLLYSAVLHRVMRAGERMREELRRAKDAAEEANAAKGAFLSTMSHEIRTPMNGVLGMTALLRETPLDARQQEFARTIENSAAALMAIINDILDFSKIEAGRMDIEPVECALLPLAQACIDILAGKAAGSGLALVAEVDPLLPAAVLADGGRLRQVLLNLLDNAIKFTPAGEVRLRLALVSRRDGLCRVRFEVSDTGIGIAPHVLPRLFQPFTQADNSVTRKYGGTGLGLSICKRLLQLMHGVMEVDSEPGRGSTFRFELALPEAAGQRGQRGQTGQSARGGQRRQGPRILLAEDNPTNQAVALHMLERLGCEVHVAADGAEALRAIGLHDYALVLMDCQMPVMDGFEATRRIRAAECGTGRHAVVVAMTANALPGDRERCLEAGMDDYLPKPITRAGLEALLRPYLPEHEADSALPVSAAS